MLRSRAEGALWYVSVVGEGKVVQRYYGYGKKEMKGGKEGIEGGAPHIIQYSFNMPLLVHL